MYRAVWRPNASRSVAARLLPRLAPCCSASVKGRLHRSLYGWLGARRPAAQGRQAPVDQDHHEAPFPQQRSHYGYRYDDDRAWNTVEQR